MAGTEYPKIETVFNRGADFGVTKELRLPEFGLVEDHWLVTEKVDGTNIRIELFPPDMFKAEPNVLVKGRTDRADVPLALTEAINAMLPVDQLVKAFGEDARVTLYGEGYGPKIQNGGWYRNDPGFILFDVRVGDWWLNWDNVTEIGATLGLDVVPVVFESASIAEVVDAFRFGDMDDSAVSIGDTQGHKPEGVVARTDPLLFTRKGERLMWKLKHKDFK